MDFPPYRRSHATIATRDRNSRAVIPVGGKNFSRNIFAWFAVKGLSPSHRACSGRSKAGLSAKKDGTLRELPGRRCYSCADARRVNETRFIRMKKTLNKRTLVPVIHDNRTRPQRIARVSSTKEFDHGSFQFPSACPLGRVAHHECGQYRDRFRSHHGIAAGGVAGPAAVLCFAL